MPSGKSSGKHSRQLLFSQAIAQLKAMAAQQTSSSPAPVSAESRTLDAYDRILQEITTDIACFSEKVTDLDQRLSTVEDHIGMLPEHDDELQSLWGKITDLEDRSRRDNVRFFGITEKREGTDIKQFLQSLLPKLTGLSFSPPLEFQRVRRIGPPRSISSGRPARSLRVSFSLSRLSRSS
ncbi:hypothetical protein NDU88_000818 [Pleurodeles waltl]|uniref:Uncharacterized protein n=1 Tax=Pleurodeles waltl TaxID=8319 RepID=A0AAV7P211_PLEWA|nr:hypothetical protein NDU88_000818 [Pleurodeles waltl]